MSLPPLWQVARRNVDWGLDLSSRSPLFSSFNIPDSLLNPNGRYAVFLGEEVASGIKIYYNPDVLMNQHIAVLGVPGSGKSFLVKQLLMRMRRKFNPALVVIDPEGEYKQWLTDATVFELGRGHKINPFDLPSDKYGRVLVDPADWAHRVANVLLQIMMEGHTAPLQEDVFKDTIARLYRDNQVAIGERPRHVPTLDEVIAALRVKRSEYEEAEKKGRNAGMYNALLSLLNKLESLQKTGVFGQGDANLGAITTGATIFDMHGVNEVSKAVVMAFIVTYLQELMNRMPVGGGEINLVVVADEAWKLLQIENSPIKNIVREGRKYGLMLIFITQMPDELINNKKTGDILSQMGTIIALRIGNAYKAKKLLEMWGYSGHYASIVANLDRGNFMARFNMRTRQVLYPLFLRNVPDDLGVTFTLYPSYRFNTARALVRTIDANMANVD